MVRLLWDCLLAPGTRVVAKAGHSAKDCKNSKNRKGGGGGGKPERNKGWFKVKCNHCGKPGHKQIYCWMRKPRSELKRPDWFSPSEHENSSMDGGSEDNNRNLKFLLSTMTLEEECSSEDDEPVPA